MTDMVEIGPSEPPYRAGLIGCGYIGSLYNESPDVGDVYSHAAAYTHCSNVQLTAVCDTDLDLARRCGQRWQVERVYTDYRTMLAEESLDIVSICTPDKTHFDIAQVVLRSGRVRAVLCEKPLATNSERGWELVSLADKCGVILSVNYSRRFHDGHQKARDLIMGGEIGSIQAIRGLYTKGIVHNGTHLIDTIRYLTGHEVLAVMGYQPRPVAPDDLAVGAVLWLEGDYLAVLQSCNEDHYAIFELDILGTHGRVCIQQSGHLISHMKPEESPRYPGSWELGAEQVICQDMRHNTLGAVQNLADCLSSGAQPICMAKDAAMDLTIAMDIKESAQTSSRIDVSKVQGGVS